MTQEILKDTNGNTASVEYFGSREAALQALDSLIECRNCSDCSRCYGCSRCSDCSGCLDCSDCSRFSDKNGFGTGTSPPIVPTIENIHSRVYAAVSQPGALNMSKWHYFDSTNCRAGRVVALAGEAGKNLERFYNTELAAMLIYDASDPGYRINPARFYDSNEDALADMRALAEAAP